MPMRKLIPAFLFIFLFACVPAYSYWIWTPKTGKWINPKTAVKPTPKEQLDLAMSLYDIKKYEDAKREFKKLVKAYPKSAEAAESQYYLGLTEEAQDNLYEAFLSYQKVIDKYPFSERIQEVIEKEYKIAQDFMAGKSVKPWEWLFLLRIQLLRYLPRWWIIRPMALSHQQRSISWGWF